MLSILLWRLPCGFVLCRRHSCAGVPCAGTWQGNALLVKAGRAPAQAPVRLHHHADSILLLTLARWLLSFGWHCSHGENCSEARMGASHRRLKPTSDHVKASLNHLCPLLSSQLSFPPSHPRLSFLLPHKFRKYNLKL